MKQNYFIVVLAHSLHGRLRRIHIPQQIVYAVVALALLGGFSLFGFVSSYMRMAWKVANYNSLRREVDSLRVRYEKLEKVNTQTEEHLATLQLFAREVSVAYGLKDKLEGPADISDEGRLAPTYKETLEEYEMLRGATLSRYYWKNVSLWQKNVVPSIWPVNGRLLSRFGERTDPFSGEGAFHKGVDLQAPYGTPVHATADGVVSFATFFSGYGRLVVIDHGSGVQTYYAHLSRIDVLPGQEVRRNEVIGALGSSGRVTAAHLHYEVRLGGSPVPPYKYMSKAPIADTAKKDFPF
jgi:murein DD-endopeptidase MepM/ murein hydrolase activator NlpD